VSDKINNSVILPACVGGIASICSDGPARFGGMVGVKVQITGTAYKLFATDGPRLVVIEGKHEGRNPIAAPDVDGPCGEAIIPASSWLTMFPKRMRDRKPLRVTLGEKESFLSRGNDSLKCSNQEGRLPDFSLVIPTGEPGDTPAMIHPGLLADLLALAEEVLDGSHVNVTIHAKDSGPGKIKITGESTDGIKFLAVLCQMAWKLSGKLSQKNDSLRT